MPDEHSVLLLFQKGIYLRPVTDRINHDITVGSLLTYRWRHDYKIFRIELVIKHVPILSSLYSDTVTYVYFDDANDLRISRYLNISNHGEGCAYTQIARFDTTTIVLFDSFHEFLIKTPVHEVMDLYHGIRLLQNAFMAT